MIRGVEANQAIDPSRLLRDTRTMGQRVHDFFSHPINVSAILLSLMGAAYILPAALIPILLLGIGCFLYGYTRHQKLPFRMPESAHTLDYNDLKPGSNKPNESRGI